MLLITAILWAALILIVAATGTTGYFTTLLCTLGVVALVAWIIHRIANRGKEKQIKIMLDRMEAEGW